MSTAIQFLRSLTKSLRPDPETLESGMPMVNTNESEPGLFFRLRDGSLSKFGPAHVGNTAPNSSPTGFPGNSIGEFWLDTSDTTYPQLKMWTADGWLSVLAEPTSAFVKGEKGQKGEDGVGTKGATGAKGVKGSKGQRGVQGDKGQKGTPGTATAKGQKGEKGEQGITSSWTDCTLSSGVLGTLRVREVAGTVQLDVRINKGGANIGTGQIGTVPADFRPTQGGSTNYMVIFLAGHKSGQDGDFSRIGVKATGEIVVLDNGSTEDIGGTGMWWG